MEIINYIYIGTYFYSNIRKYIQIEYNFSSKYFILEHSTKQIYILIHPNDYYLIDRLPNSKKLITLECAMSMVLNNSPNNLIIDYRF